MNKMTCGIKTNIIAACMMMLLVMYVFGCSSVDRKAPVNAPSKVLFEIRLAQDSPADGFTKVENTPPNMSIYASDQVAFTNVDIKKAKMVLIQGQPSVEFKLNDQSSKRMEKFTAQNLNKKIAIFINGRLVAAPMIRGVIKEKGIIHGNFTEDQAKEIAKGLMMK